MRAVATASCFVCGGVNPGQSDGMLKHMVGSSHIVAVADVGLVEADVVIGTIAGP